MLQYHYNSEALTIREQKNQDDIEFFIRIKDESLGLPAIRKVREDFDRNEITTDVLFYPHHGNEYQVIVRQDFYVDFVLSMFKHRLLQSVSWT